MSQRSKLGDGRYSAPLQGEDAALKCRHGALGNLEVPALGDTPATRSFERVGSSTPISVDVRFVAATHRDLEVMIARGEFREDLYYRLAEIVVTIPPLRDRAGDPALLAHAVMQPMVIGEKFEWESVV